MSAVSFRRCAAAVLHHLDELLVDLVDHRLRIGLVLLVLRRERIEHALVLAGGEQAALDAELFHRAGEAEAVHQHADRADQARLVDVDLVGGHRDVVGARGAHLLDHRVHLLLVLGLQAPDLVVDDAGLHRAAAGRLMRSTTACDVASSNALLQRRRPGSRRWPRRRPRSRRAPRSARCAGRWCAPRGCARRTAPSDRSARTAAATPGGRTCASAARCGGRAAVALARLRQRRCSRRRRSARRRPGGRGRRRWRRGGSEPAAGGGRSVLGAHGGLSRSRPGAGARVVEDDGPDVAGRIPIHLAVALGDSQRRSGGRAAGPADAAPVGGS